MSVVRGRPPGLAGGIIGASRAYCSSLRACPAPKSPTRARLSAVHMACLREGLLPSRTGRRPACATCSPRRRRLLKQPLTLPCHLHSRRWCSKCCRQCGQRRSTRVSAATIPRRTAGRVGAGGGPGGGAVWPLFPPEPQVLQEGEGEQAQERVVVQPAPRAALEVVEPQLVLELLMQLLADPPALDQGGQDLERRLGREIGYVVLALARGAVLADQPRLLPREVLPARVGRPVGHAHTQGGELGLEETFGPEPPRDGAERRRPRLEQLGRRYARGRGHRVLAGPAARLALREAERHVRRGDLLGRQDAHREAELPLREAGPAL